MDMDRKFGSVLSARQPDAHTCYYHLLLSACERWMEIDYSYMNGSIYMVTYVACARWVHMGWLVLWIDTNS